MANKRNREIWEKEEKERKFARAKKGLNIYPIISAVAAVVVLLLFLIKWAGVYNNSAKVYETPVFTGTQLIAAALSGDYEIVTDSNGLGLYYHFVKDNTLLIGAFGVVALVTAAVGLIMQIITLATKKYVLNAVSACVFALSFISLLICYITALSAGYPLMVGYQCNLKVCEHRSYIIFPAIFALVSAAASAVGGAKYFNAKKVLK